MVTVTGENVTGSDDTVNLRLNDLTEGTSATPDEFTITEVDAAGLENINIESTGVQNTKNTITKLDAKSQDTVTITGDTLLTIGNTLDAPTVDASASTGGVDIDVAGTGAQGGEQDVTGSKGDDTILVDTATLDEDDTTIDAGDGDDTLAFSNTGTLNFNTVNDVAPFSGVSNFELLSFGAAGGTTLNISDAFLDVFSDNTINIVAPEDINTNVTLDASKIVNSSSTINVDASPMSEGGGSGVFNFSINNGTSTFVGTDNDDTVTVTTGAYLDDGDSLDGGDGTNTLAFSTNSATVIQASQLSGIENFSAVTFTHDANATADAFEITLDNAFASANQDGGTLTLETVDGDNGGDEAFEIDASAFSSAIDVTLTLDDKAGVENNVSLGGGDDLVLFGAATDEVTLGSGDDIVAFTGNTATNSDITDFDFGTSSGTGANVDVISLSGKDPDGAAITGAGAIIDDGNDTVVLASDVSIGVDTPTSEVFVLDLVAQNDAAAVDARLAAVTNDGAYADAVFVIWQDGLGNVNYGIDADAGIDNTGTDITILGTLGKHHHR